MKTLLHIKLSLVVLILMFRGACLYSQDNEKPLYMDYKQPFKARVSDLLSRMTMEEKLSQMISRIPTELKHSDYPDTSGEVKPGIV